GGPVGEHQGAASDLFHLRLGGVVFGVVGVVGVLAGEAGGAGEGDFVASVLEDGGAVADDGTDEDAVVEADVVGDEFGVGALVAARAVAVDVDADDQRVWEVVVTDVAWFGPGLVECDLGVLALGVHVFEC